MGARFFFFQAEDGIRDSSVTGVQTCALPIFLDDVREHFQNYRLVLWVESQIWIFPVAENAQPAKLIPLNFNILSSVLLVALAHFQRRQTPRFLERFEFDG